MTTAFRILLFTALFSLAFIEGAFATSIAFVAIAVAGIREFQAARKGKAALCDAHIYKHLELGTLLYCDSAQATHTDYQYLGTAKVKCSNVGNCSLS